MKNQFLSLLLLTFSVLNMYAESELSPLSEVVVSESFVFKDLKHTDTDNLKTDSYNQLIPEAFMKDCGSLPDSLYIFTVKDISGTTHYVTASNGLGYTSFGQIFKEKKSNLIISVEAYLVKITENEPKDIYAKIYELDDNNLPSNLLAVSEPLSSSQIIFERHSSKQTFNFSTPVIVPENFAVILDFPPYEEGELQMGVASSDQGCYGFENAVLVYIADYGFFNLIELYKTYNWASYDLPIIVNVDVDYVTDLKSIQNNNYTIYPNPATDVIYIENATDSEVRMIDATGKVVIERSIQNAKESLEINQLERGIYFLEISAEEGKSVNKIIKN